jgi:hypothetical protein
VRVLLDGGTHGRRLMRKVALGRLERVGRAVARLMPNAVDRARARGGPVTERAALRVAVRVAGRLIGRAGRVGDKCVRPTRWS